jgi:hypothetical protein
MVNQVKIHKIKIFALLLFYFASICALVILHFIPYRVGVRVYTVGPNGLDSCFSFHTNTSLI